MNVARYIELCDRLRDMEDGPEYDRLIEEIDLLYKSMSAQEIADADAAFEAREPG